MQRRHFELIRQRSQPNDGCRTLFFTTAGGCRKHPAKFLRPENVPDFEGDRAFFFCERGKDGVWRAVERTDQLRRPYTGPPEG
jgi:hypothetical protein